ncbi:hypothetical protein RHMOL_Rhmol04G0231500 [Rhododendron molle]|uniref:Uncharacterized protein n=1 Tax=Rhododendron molle TaxID=49168 RepID=A0ACC0P5W3_RHOML|nr:hypothetical protein RHMOL_Rhmol04G0231500 [Rhododendron molle]
MNLTKSLPRPVTPELELPYTAEECEPLPPEEFPESEEEIEDLIDDIAEGGDGSSGKKMGDGGNETMAERELVNTEKDVEKEAEKKAEDEVAADAVADVARDTTAQV